MDPSITFLLGVGVGVGVGVLATCAVHVALIWQGLRDMDANGDPLPPESTDLPPHHRKDTR